MGRGRRCGRVIKIAPRREVCHKKKRMLTRFEVTKIVGIRAVQLSEGTCPHVSVEQEDLRNDYTYVASLELYNRVLDVCVTRGSCVLHVADVLFPVDLALYLNTRDGQDRRLYDTSQSLSTEDSLTSKDKDSSSKESFSS